MKAKANRYTVFFDFDNTITTRDIIDDIVFKFSKDDRWRKLESDWASGKIGSRACLKGQIEGVRVAKDILDEYLANIKLDPSFKKLLCLLGKHKIKTFVLSDNFEYILTKVLKNHKICGLKVHANKIEFVEDRLFPYFPFGDKSCSICGHCKKKNFFANLQKKAFSVYIGDGLSDVCAAKYANFVFAKGTLLRYFRREALECIPYKTLGDVYKYFKDNLL